MKVAGRAADVFGSLPRNSDVATLLGAGCGVRAASSNNPPRPQTVNFAEALVTGTDPECLRVSSRHVFTIFLPRFSRPRHLAVLLSCMIEASPAVAALAPTACIHHGPQRGLPLVTVDRTHTLQLPWLLRRDVHMFRHSCSRTNLITVCRTRCCVSHCPHFMNAFQWALHSIPAESPMFMKTALRRHSTL